MKVRDDLLTALSGAVLPTIDEMQTLRMLGRECSDLAYAIEAATGEPHKPLDVLEALRFAMHERHAEFEHRWMRTRPTGRPDFADRPWHKTVDALRTLEERAS
jgi:hypothetical protein